MPGKVRKCLRDKTLRNVLMSSLSETDKKCILDVFIRYEQMLDRETAQIQARWKGAGLGDYYCSNCLHTVSGNHLTECPECKAIMETSNE